MKVPAVIPTTGYPATYAAGFFCFQPLLLRKSVRLSAAEAPLAPHKEGFLHLRPVAFQVSFGGHFPVDKKSGTVTLLFTGEPADFLFSVDTLSSFFTLVRSRKPCNCFFVILPDRVRGDSGSPVPGGETFAGASMPSTVPLRPCFFIDWLLRSKALTK